MLKRAVVRFLDACLDRPRITLVLFGTLMAVTVLALVQLRFDQSTDTFFDMKAPHFVDRRILEDQFGGRGGEMIVTLTAPDIFTERNLHLLARLTATLEQLNGVEKVISLATVSDMIGEKDNFIVEKVTKEIPSDDAGLARLKKRVLSNPLYVKNVISPDGRTAGLIVKVEEAKDEGGNSRAALVGEVRSLLANEAPADIETHLTGSTTLDVDYQGYMQRDMNVFLPLAMVLMAVVLFLTFRRVRLMTMPMIVVGASLMMTMSLIHWFGFKINSITVTVPPIVMGVVIGDSIHYVLYALRHRKGGADATLRATFRRMLFPCLMTSVTTAVGFLSLLTSRSPAMRELGLVASCGTMIAYGVTFVLLPSMMKLFCRLDDDGLAAPLESRPDGDRMDRWLHRLADIYVRRHRSIVLVAVAVGLAGVAGISRIRVESSMLEQFNRRSPVYLSTLFLEKHLTGVEMLHISMKCKAPDGFKDPAVLRAMERIQAQVAAAPCVDKVISVIDFVKDMNQSFHDEQAAFYTIPDTRQMVAQYALLYGATDLEDYMNPDWSWAVMNVRMNEHVSKRLGVATENIHRIVMAGLPPGVTADLLGPVRTEVEGVDTVVRGQIWSLVTSFGIVFAIMFVAFRSFSAGLVSVLPNVLPLFVNFGIMGIAGIRLDTATSLISAIAIGIIVDNTIHFVDGYRQYLGESGSDEEAMRQTVLAKGRAIVFTTAVLVCSFGVLMFSAFVPIFQFGLLCAILMITAMAGDLVVMPCLALWARPKFPGTGLPAPDEGGRNNGRKRRS